ncbi:MAG TPA: hypothetical protein VF476_04400, partial [Chitinophagaceae bacterium]
ALAVYLKKEDDYFRSSSPATQMITYNGFSIIKEFYAPDYAVSPKNGGPDHRMTLYWKPDIIVNGKNSKVPIFFYNNDRTESFKVVIEGMTTDGKMLLIEKLISSKAF